MNKPLRIYLSGGMEYADNEGRDWRFSMSSWLTSHFDAEIFNPNAESDKFLSAHYPDVDLRALKNSDMPKFTDIITRIVEIDCREIAENSDIVICWWDDSAMRGAGTKGELTMARYFGKPVYLITSHPLESIPGWVLGCVTRFFSTFEEFQSFLLNHVSTQGRSVGS